MSLQPLHIQELVAKYPIIQGGMGVGISRSNLAGAVAREGGIGIISSAQIGYDEPEFQTDPIKANVIALKKHIELAKEKANGGIVGVNIMVALKRYEEHVKTSIEAGADVIISGAGLPIELPKYVGEAKTKIAPIVSSKKAAMIILKMWDKKYKRTADFLVIEGPLAGGHLGFKRDQLDKIDMKLYDEEIKRIIECKKPFEEKYNTTIPIVVAGGIETHEQILHYMQLGANGVQIASPFVVTEECDASLAYKQAYLDAKEEDICIVESPVGMPGRALKNKFVKKVKEQREKITKCDLCLVHCNPNTIPYCITKALINAVKGDLDNGLIFCGANISHLSEMTTVKKLMKKLATGEEK